MVKVRRPGVTEVVAVDLDLVEAMAARVAKRLPIAARYDLPALANQFGTTLREELDYLAEATNAEQFAANFAGTRLCGSPECSGISHGPSVDS